MRETWRFGILLIGMLLVVGGEAAAATVAPVLNPGAVLEISVYASGKKELDFTATVQPDSTIMAPLVGTTKVTGMDATKSPRACSVSMTRTSSSIPRCS
jgi:protein involved in polysaccharide export with SLBB domain